MCTILPDTRFYACEVIFGMYIDILPPLMHIEQFWHVAYIWYLKGIFVAGIFSCIMVNKCCSFFNFDGYVQ